MPPPLRRWWWCRRWCHSVSEAHFLLAHSELRVPLPQLIPKIRDGIREVHFLLAAGLPALAVAVELRAGALHRRGQRVAMLGPEHARTLNAKQSLGTCLQDMAEETEQAGDRAGAAELYRTAADMQEARYGKDDGHVVACRAKALELGA